MSSGRIVSVIGAVIDVEFPRDEVPQVYDALKVDEVDLTLEVQQQLGDGVVRTIAMGSSEGIARGLPVSNTDAPISVPVGEDIRGPAGRGACRGGARGEGVRTQGCARPRDGQRARRRAV